MAFAKRMAESPENRFAKISEAYIENIKGSAVPSKTMEATKYGVKLFKGKKNTFYVYSTIYFTNKNL